MEIIGFSFVIALWYLVINLLYLEIKDLFKEQ